MSTIADVRARNVATLRLAAEQSESYADMRKVLREEGFSFKPSVVRRAWDAVKAHNERERYDDVLACVEE